MKKSLLICFLLCTASAFGDYKFDVAFSKWERFSENALSFASSIVDNNTHVYENKLTKKERYFNDEFVGRGTSPVIWERVWAKDKTIVTAWATSNKKFHADSIETTDPNFAFNGIHVGSSIRDLEKYFGASVSDFNESSKNGVIYGSSQSEEGFMVLITHNNSVITKITVSTLDWAGGFPVPSSQKTHSFLASTRRKMNIPDNPEPFGD